VWAELRSVVDTRVCVVDMVRSPRGVISRLALDHVGVVGWARRRRLDVLHLPKGHLPLWVPRRLICVATVHDDIAVRYARNEFGPGGRTAKTMYFARAVTRAVASADRVLTVSAFSARRLSMLAPVDPAKLVVTYEAPILPSVPFVAFSRREPSLLILGSRFPHKRTAQTVAWTQRFVATPAGDGLRVVVTGQLDQKTERMCGDGGITRIRGVVSPADFAGLIARSRVLVFGSAYEGFGLPPVESYALGTPATYQRVGAMAEVLDGFPGGYPEARFEAFAKALTEVLALDEAALMDLRERMRARFQWGEVVRTTLDAYRAAVSQRRD
jgi:glycosyltransferase involved in cell wall biosynthesis